MILYMRRLSSASVEKKEKREEGGRKTKEERDIEKMVKRIR